jgi:two-component system sensor histidine kinase DesK
MLESAGISVRWEEDGGDLPPEAETVLAWAVREGATNVLRHSRARECMVKLDRRNGSAVLEMVDDGVGEARSSIDGGLGNGLRGLGERVAAIISPPTAATRCWRQRERRDLTSPFSTSRCPALMASRLPAS